PSRADSPHAQRYTLLRKGEAGRIEIRARNLRFSRAPAAERLYRGMTQQEILGCRWERKLKFDFCGHEAHSVAARIMVEEGGLPRTNRCYASPATLSRRTRTASASDRRTSTVVSHPMQASVIDTPYCSVWPGTRS